MRWGRKNLLNYEMHTASTGKMREIAWLIISTMTNDMKSAEWKTNLDPKFP